MNIPRIIQTSKKKKGTVCYNALKIFTGNMNL